MGAGIDMARVRITYWRDIPVLVQARDDLGEASVSLSPRFQELVDVVAMQEGCAAEGDYLAGWRQGAEEEEPGAPDAAAQAVAQALERRFAEIRARALRGGPPSLAG
jgi:hypothetical protein